MHLGCIEKWRKFFCAINETIFFGLSNWFNNLQQKKFYLLMYDLKPLFTLSSCSPYSSYVETLYSGVFYFSYLKTTYQWHMLGDTLLEVRLLYLTKTFLGFRVQINVLWFGKYNTVFIFHYAVFSTNRENHDTKIW